MTLVILTAFLAVSFLPGGLASPAGVRVRDGHRPAMRCRPHWGWPGSSFSNDHWGNVIDPKLALANSDGGPGASSASAAAPAPSSPTPPARPASSAPQYSAPSSPAAMPPAHNATSTSLSTPQSPPPHAAHSSSPSSPPHTTPSPSPRPPPSSPAPPPPPPSSPASSSGPTSPSDIQAYLAGHNTVRAQHGAAPLTYSQDLAAKAQQWANGCQFRHSGGSLGPFGENLAAGTGPSYDIAAALKSWTDEASQYNPNNPQPSHFTQIVWRKTSKVGCAVQLCDGIFAPSFGKAKYYVCEYFEQGNVIGEFAQNVQA